MLEISINFLKIILKNKNLLSTFILRDIKTRVIGSFGGILWLLINPLCNILVYIFVFGYILKIKLLYNFVGTENFSTFLLSGIFLWLAFSEGIMQSLNILIHNSNIITKVYFPVSILPVSVVVSSFLVNLIGLLFFLIYLIFNDYCTIYWIFLIIYLILLFIFTIGLSLMLSALTVFVRDLQQLINIVLFIWFYATPIIYPTYMLPKFFQKLIILNPLLPFIEGFKISLLKKSINFEFLLWSLIWSLIFFIFGAFIFEKLKKSFADVL